MIYKKVIRPLFFGTDPEDSHDLTYALARKIANSDTLLHLTKSIFNSPEANSGGLLKQDILGISFPNPVGLAAGFDKNGYLPGFFEALGFGYVEVGSITANASAGNPKPRLFRLPEEAALINRLGLNNQGSEEITKRLASQRIGIPLGVNIAKTHNPQILGKDAILDYKKSWYGARTVADYVTINISCPNTEEGKTFEDPIALDELLAALYETASTTIAFIKFSADLRPQELEKLFFICEKYGIDGYIASNTSAQRTHLSQTSESRLNQIGRGGLSGKPLFSRSLSLVEQLSEMTSGEKPIVGVGGIFCAEDALAMFKAGAWLIQTYTGLVYEGPFIARNICAGVQKHMKQEGLSSMADLRESR